ncbi:MAG TPA: glycosyltransferase family 9 protein [Urbifossiella sp.]|nr:glycosyltransferase family 9 protein [Urbifossiella sp.]
MRRLAELPAAAWVLAALALALAAAGARPYAGGWNDGCRLAAVESLVDRGTLAIDDSVFCKCPQQLIDSGHTPYPAADAGLLAAGTLDKLYVNGHYYSDKPAVVSVLMAALYRPLVWLGVPSPGERPDVFAWVMTVLTSGVGYAAAVGCLWVLGGRVGLTPGVRLGWLAAFALATYAPAYTRHVNAGAAQLGVVAAMCLILHQLSRESPGTAVPGLRLLLLGTLAGLGFNLDFGTGPPLAAATVLVVAWRFGRVGPTAVVLLALLPWVAAGVGINYAVSGKWLPMNMYPETHQWPGCPFTEANLTGYRRHGPLDQALYTAAMMFGKHGFLNHNLPLLLGVAGVGVLRRRFPGRGELVMMLGWCAAAWALYAVLSNNMGGANTSVRWFVPFLAPGFWLLAVLLKERPELRADFAVLSAGGAVLGAVMWTIGPWTGRMIPGMWPIVGVTLLAWGVAARRRAPARGGAMSVARMRVIDVWLGTPVCLLLTLWRAVFGTPAEGAARPRKILFMKLAEQGSTVLAEPALRAAAARVGRENVYFVLFGENRPILDLLGLVPPENVIAIRTGGLVRTVVGALKALRAIRRAGIDAVVDLEFFARSTAALGYLTGARWRSGFHPGGGAGRYRGDLLTHRVSFNPYLHTAQAFALLVEALDHPAEMLPRLAHVPAAPEPGRLSFTPSPAEEAEVRSLLRADLGRHAAGELLLLNANASDLMPLRRWAPERYVELARRLLAEHPRAAVVFTGAPAEAAAAAELVRAVGSDRCASLAGKTTLRQLLVLDTLAEVLVTNDSGPAHFATLTPVDVVVLFGPETPRLFAGVGGRTHPLWAGLACSPCINAFNDRNSACRDNACMTAITVGAVAEEVGRVLAARRAPARRAA